MTYRFLPHTADTLVALEADTLEGLFAEATTVVRILLAGDAAVREAQAHEVCINAASGDELIHHYVRELLAEFQLDTFLPARLDPTRLSPTELVGVLWGEPFDQSRHEPQPEVKAVTWHGLCVRETESGWSARFVLDL